MEDFSLFPSDNFIYQLPAKTSTPRSAWEPTSFLPVYFIKTYNASLGRRHNKIQATGLPHVYDNHSWQLFLLQREKAQENGTSIAGSWQVRHGTSSTLGVLSTALLFVLLSSSCKGVCNSGHVYTKLLSVQNEQFIILSLLFLQIPTHPASQNMQVGSKPGKTHFNSCISVYSLNVCPLPYILRTYHNSVNKTMRKRRCKECILNANRVQAKECFLKTKNGFKQSEKPIKH